MHILGDTDVKNLEKELQRRVPQVVLSAIARAGTSGLTQGAVMRIVRQMCPTTMPQEGLSEHALSSLAWFRYHGDVHAGTYRYLIMPPYGVALDMAEGDSKEIVIQLCGDPRRDKAVATQLAEVGIDVTNTTVEWEKRWSGCVIQMTVGWHRQIVLSLDQMSVFQERLSRFHIPIISTAEMEQNLPNISGLLVPPYSACTVLPPLAGTWMVYAPESSNQDRWKALDSWQDASSGLLRWRTDDEDHRQTDYRYFYHCGQERMVELSQSTAALWTFKLDSLANHLRQLWVDGAELWLPADMPDPHRQWIQLQDERVRWRTDRPYAQLSFPALNVARRIAYTLGLKLTLARPS